MPLVSQDQKQAFVELQQSLRSAAKDQTLTTNKAEVRLVSNQHSEAVTRGFTLVQDEPASVGGGGTAPTPTDFFIAAVGFCENVIFVRNASLLDLSIDSLETHVSGTWDRRGLFDIDGVEPAFQKIVVETRVTTKDPVERVVEVANLTHKRCPVHATLRKSTPVTFVLVVNGRQVPL